MGTHADARWMAEGTMASATSPNWAIQYDSVDESVEKTVQ